HRPPRAARVARTRIEHPVEDHPGARLQPRPASGDDGERDHGGDPPEGAVDAAGLGDEVRALRREPDSDVTRAGGALEGRARGLADLAAVVREQQLAERLAHLERVPEIALAERRLAGLEHADPEQ